MSPKKIAFITLIVASLFVIYNMVQSIYTLWQKRHLVIDARTEVERQQKANKDLKRKLSQVENPRFIEQEARDKLFLAKPGEGIIVAFPKDLEASSSVKPKPVDTRPNWKKWWDLFF